MRQLLPLAVLFCALLPPLSACSASRPVGPVGQVVDVLAASREEPDWSTIDSPERALDYVIAHPDEVSFFIATLGEDGQPLPESVVERSADEPKVLASTMKIVVLSALARAVDEGLDPEEPVTLEVWDSWTLPGTDGGAHAAAYARLDVDHERGVAASPEHTVSLRQVASAMIRESDNSATDLLIHRLGDRMQAETERLGHDPIPPLLATFDAMFQGDVCAEPPALRATDTLEERALIRETAVLKTPLRAQRARLACVLPRGSARAYATLMGQVMRGTHISEQASAFMREQLEWPEPSERFEGLGTKGGAVAGVLTEATYATPRSGPWAGQGRVVALFANEMSGSAWLGALRGGHSQQELLLGLLDNPSWVERLASEVTSE